MSVLTLRNYRLMSSWGGGSNWSDARQGFAPVWRAMKVWEYAKWCMHRAGRVYFCIATPVEKELEMQLALLCTILPWHSVNVSLSLTPQSDCQIHLQSQVTPAHMEEYLSSIHMHPQASPQLNKFRLYLSVARQLDYSISDEMTKVRHAVIFNLSWVAQKWVKGGKNCLIHIWRFMLKGHRYNNLELVACRFVVFSCNHFHALHENSVICVRNPFRLNYCFPNCVKQNKQINTLIEMYWIVIIRIMVSDPDPTIQSVSLDLQCVCLC